MLEKTDKKSPTGKQGSLSKKHPFAKKLQVAHSRTETILNHRESLLEKSHKPNRKLARQLSIENVGSVCGSSVGKNSKRSFDTRNGLSTNVNHYSSAVQHTKAKKAKLATVGSNRMLVEHNYMSKLEGEMPLDLLGNTRKKKAAVNRIKSGSGDLSKFNTLPSAHIPVALGSLHKKENSASSLIRRCASQRTFEEVKPSARRTAHKRVDSKKNLRTSRSALSKSSVHHLQSVLQENQPGRSDSLLEPVVPARTQKMGLHYRTGSLLKEENKRQVFTKSTQNSSTKVLKSRIKHKKSKTIRSPPKHNQKPSLNIGNSKFALDVGRNATQYKQTSEYEIAKSRTDRDRTDPSQTTGRYRDVREHTDEDGFVVFRTEWADNPHNIERLESNSSDQDSEVILEEDVLDVEELPSCHKIKILPSQILSRNVSNNKDPVLKGEEMEPTTKERKAHNEPTNTGDEKWPIRGQYRRKTLMGDEILENLTIIKSNQKTHIGKSSSENGGDPYNPPATQNSDDSMRFGRRKLIFAESQQVQSGKKSVIKSTGDDLAQFLGSFVSNVRGTQGSSTEDEPRVR